MGTLMKTIRKRMLRLGDRNLALELEGLGEGRWRFAADGVAREITIQSTGPSSCRIQLGEEASPRNATFARDAAAGRIWVHLPGEEILVFDEPKESGRKRSSGRGGGGGLTAPMPGKVVKIELSAGSPVRAGETILVLEAMKMEHAIRAPRDGILRHVTVAVGEMVSAGQPLAEVEEEAAPQP
jgi:biotin carboxyl carrier protein